MQFSPHKPHNVPERFDASVATVCTTALSAASGRAVINLKEGRRPSRAAEV